MNAPCSAVDLIFEGDLESKTLPPVKIISEASENEISFNVMPG
jgi:hypothetical protein